jgi:hypothetical protein
VIVLTIVAIWAIVIPVLILAISWQITKPRPNGSRQIAQGPASMLRGEASRSGVAPGCAVPAARPRRTITRRLCPALARGVRRRPASA